MSRLSVDIRLSHPGFDLQVAQAFPEQGITAIFGRSGSGKSSLLRAIAGLEERTTGELRFGSEVWLDQTRMMPAYRRGIGMVFQDARLFDHLSVEGNLHFAKRRAPNGQSGVSLDIVAQAMGISHLMTRRTTDLSGGERQRVALARALLSKPRLLLLDEPLAALDMRSRAEILPLIADLPARFGVPILYVTHALAEVTQLADHMVVLDRGRVIVAGGVADCLDNPAILPATGRFESSTMLEGQVLAVDPSLQITTVAVGDVRMDTPGTTIAPGSPVRLRIRARDVSLALRAPDGLSIRNVLPGRITRIEEEPDTAFAEVTVDIGAGHLRARITRASVADMGLCEGKAIFALVKSVSFDRRLLSAGR